MRISHARVEGNRALGGGAALGDRFGGVEETEQRGRLVPIRQAGMDERVLRSDPQSRHVVVEAFLQAGYVVQVPQVAGAQVRVLRFMRHAGPASQRRPLRRRQVRADALRDLVGDLRLNPQHVGHRPVVRFRPHRRIAGDVDQMDCDSQLRPETVRYCITEVREMTRSPVMPAILAMSSSVIPSAR